MKHKENESDSSKEIIAIEHQAMGATHSTDPSNNMMKSRPTSPAQENSVGRLCSNDDKGSQAATYPKELEILIVAEPNKTMLPGESLMKGRVDNIQCDSTQSIGQSHKKNKLTDCESR